MTLPGVVDKKYILWFSLGLMMAISPMQKTIAQVTSANADHVDTLTYLPGNSAEDPLFVFYQLDNVSKPGSLTATPPGSGNFNFEWREYNPAINGFGPVFSSESGTTSSSVSDLGDGGYSVRVWNGTGTDVTWMSWVMLDHFRDSVAQTTDGMLPGYLYTCDFVGLAGYVFPDTLVYYDLLSHEMISRPIGFGFQWTSDNADLDIPNDTIVLRPNISFKPPYKDTEYYLTASDNFGMRVEDNVFYESIQTKALFSAEYHDKVTGEYVDDLTGDWSLEKGSLDAMLTVRFINESLNGERFDWVFLDTLGGTLESETTYEVESLTEFTYEAADKYYYPYMISNSEEGCTDTARLDEAIHVVPSQLAIPNVFSPNGDGVNDFFVFKHQSLKTCKVTIVDRNGKVVYKQKIEDIYTWDGWDGNLHNSSRQAPEGQYYYVVEALGYDGVEYSDPTIIDQWRNKGSTGGSTGGTDPTDPEAVPNTLYTGWLYIYRNKGTF